MNSCWEPLRARVEKKTTEHVEKFLQPFEIVDFTDAMTYDYAEIRKNLEQSGKIIGANDLLIAATAVHENAILVTHNTNEFSRVKGLKVIDWVEG